MKIYIAFHNHTDDEGIVSTYLLGTFTTKELAEEKIKSEVDVKVKYLEEISASHSIGEKAEVSVDKGNETIINFGYDTFTYYIVETTADRGTYEPLAF